MAATPSSKCRRTLSSQFNSHCPESTIMAKLAKSFFFALSPMQHVIKSCLWVLLSMQLQNPALKKFFQQARSKNTGLSHFSCPSGLIHLVLQISELRARKETTAAKPQNNQHNQTPKQPVSWQEATHVRHAKVRRREKGETWSYELEESTSGHWQHFASWRAFG